MPTTPVPTTLRRLRPHNTTGMEFTPNSWSPGYFWRQKVVRPLVGLLRVGVTPVQISQALALGATIGLLPTVGTTTAICLLIGGALRLNQVATQLSNYAVTPIQIALILPFLRLGETILGVEQRLPLSGSEIAQRAQEQGLGFTLDLGRSIVHALLGWASCAIPVFLAVFLVSRFALVRLARSRRKRLGAT